MSIITKVDNNSLQLPEYVDDLTINSDEKLNFDVRVWFYSLAMFLSFLTVVLLLGGVVSPKLNPQ